MFISQTMRRSAELAASAILLLGLALYAGAENENIKVKIENFTFNPTEITIPQGSKVTFINEDDIPHMVVDRGSTFRSKALDTGDEFSFSFKDPGEYPFFCSLHPMMIGKIIVKTKPF